ncbi:hypothetical protein Tco_1253275 [Tanacetum coccineum]
MARCLVLLEELVDVAGSTFLRYQMYMLFQRKRKDYIAEMEVLGPRLLTVEALINLREIHRHEAEKLYRLRTMLDESNARLHQKRCYCSKVLTTC